MTNIPLDELSSRLEAAIDALESAIPQMESALDPSRYVETVVVKLLFPVVRDIALSLKTLHEDIEVEAAGYPDHVKKLIQVCQDLVLSDILPIQWTAALLTTLNKPMFEAGFVKSAQDFTELFHKQIKKLGEEGKRLESLNP